MTQIGALMVIEKLQPQLAAFLSSVNRTGAITMPGDAFFLAEVSPTSAVEVVADIAFKTADVRPSLFQRDGRVGYVAVHSASDGDMREIVSQAAVALGQPNWRPKPTEIVGDRLVNRIDPNHAYLTNRLRSGALCRPGDSLFVIECHASPNALVAANAAEAAADIRLVDMRFTGSMGRTILSGDPENIRIARQAALDAVRGYV